ncbi:hypothetical protein HN51_040430 [Arachis hypogaea]
MKYYQMQKSEHRMRFIVYLKGCSTCRLAWAKLSGLQRKMGSVDDKEFEKVDVSGFLSSSSDVVASELQAAKEEIEKLEEEADGNKSHMLQVLL